MFSRDPAGSFKKEFTTGAQEAGPLCHLKEELDGTKVDHQQISKKLKQISEMQYG